MDVTAAEKGDEVLSLLQKALDNKRPVELCVINIRMPDMNGYGLATQIRNFRSSISDHQYSIRNLHLIALSPLLNREEQNYKEAGFDDFLSKPVRKEKLYKVLEDAVNKHRVMNGGRHQKDLNFQKHDKNVLPALTDNTHSAHILLAEDNPINQKLAKMMLVKAGYQVQTAGTGKEALDRYIASTGNFDLILMDMQMPEMDGIEATRLIREWEEKVIAKGQNPNTESPDHDSAFFQKDFSIVNHQSSIRRVPIVALTANAIKGDKEKCLEGGMDDYITKPINKKLFFEVIEKWLALDC
jgi:CheY-like chemotaxis protein